MKNTVSFLVSMSRSARSARFARSAQVALLALLVALCGACATAPSKEPKVSTSSGAAGAQPAVQVETPVMTSDGLAQLQIAGAGVLFVKPAHLIGSYDHFFIDEVFVTYGENQRELDPEIERMLVQHLQESLDNAVLNSGLPVTEDPGPYVLRIGLGIGDLQLAELRDRTGSSTRFVNSLGSMTLMTEFRDSVTGEALLRYANRQIIAGGMYNPGSAGFRWRKLRETFDQLMIELNLTLAHNVPQVMAESQLRAECQGRIHQYGTAIRAATSAPR